MHRRLELLPSAAILLAFLALAPDSLAGEPAHARSTAGALFSDELELPDGAPLVVKRSGRVRAGLHLRVPLGPGGRGGVIVVEKQENLTLDLTGVVLRGAATGTALDELAGHAIVVRDCKNVTIRGGTISGYAACIVVEKSSGVVLEGVTCDGWYGMRLLSTTAAENEADWLWPHENDEGQWLTRYGGALSLTDCEEVIVRGCRGRHGQNGILTLRCRGLQIVDCDFSFLSGWGLALYRTSESIVSHNVFDYCVRGYSHGVYWRGQDSAAILMFERCSDNLIAFNSATHSGDGIFLFAGRDSVEGKAFERGETEVGGCDRNRFFGNDFSYAVANGIEATFSSDNSCVANRIVGCHQHGIWGGYSRRMQILQNEIERTLGGAITVEHGQDFLIAENVLHDNQVAVELYWDEDADLVKGPFGKRFDTSSKGHVVLANSFSGNDSDFAVTKTTEVRVGENVYAANGRELAIADVRSFTGEARDTAAVRALFTGIGGWSASGRLADVTLEAAAPGAETSEERAAAIAAPNVPGSQIAIDPERQKTEGLDTIVMGEWGPWDFRSKEPRPVQRAPGGLLAETAWDAVWFSWKAGPDPRGSVEDLEKWRALAREPVASARVKSWTTPWAADGELQKKVGSAHFGVIANAEVELAAGRYRLAVVSDDGVRVRVDGASVVENWTWHAPTRDTADFELAAGKHAFLLEYFQIDGASALSLSLEKLK
ncbi:MAG TPA: right-handed parallel beta-helix repeat-containing protein [Planctomycetota bacterium]|nr:right-handed parallel beta-helix repeat-containing protein [Planctomycetota bacterium]